MIDSQSQPCLPVRSGEGIDGTNEVPGVTDRGGTLKRPMEGEGEAVASKHPRVDTEVEEAEKEDGQRASEASPEGHPSPAERSTEDPSVLGQARDVHRTGAKCVPGAPADPRGAGPGYHGVGVLRVKPGRGELTLSLSCSDKMARWAVLGCQGALLSHYLQGAIRFSAVVTGKCPYSPAAMQRALTSR